MSTPVCGWTEYESQLPGTVVTVAPPDALVTVVTHEVPHESGVGITSFVYQSTVSVAAPVSDWKSRTVSATAELAPVDGGRRAVPKQLVSGVQPDAVVGTGSRVRTIVSGST